MKSKISKVFLSFLTVIILLTGTLSVLAEENGQTVGEAYSLIDGIVDFQKKSAEADSVQSWINGSLTRNAGISSEWYIIALSQYGDYDFTAYEKALCDYLDSNDVISASSRQKYALALIACGSTDRYIYSVLNNSIGQQGVMSWIFGLHLLNNGYTSRDYSLSDVKKKILSLQLGDGGWSVAGNNSDVDVTAMAIQALAPYYENDSSVRTAVDTALTFLSNRQRENGDYASYGVNNPESTAQVLVALSALGIDCEYDSRFIKNGNTIFDGIRLYQLENGSFCHKQGGETNGTATVQVFYSMVSYLRMKNGQTSLYVLDARNPSELEIPKDATVDVVEVETATNKNTDEKNKTEKYEGTTIDNTLKPVSNSDTKESNEETVDLWQSQSASETTETDDETISSETREDSLQNEHQSTVDGKEINEEDSTAYETESDITQKDSDESKQEKNVLSDDVTEDENRSGAYKLWVCVGISLVAGGIGIALFAGKKRNKGNFIIIGVVAIATIIFVLATDFQSADSYYNQSDADKNKTIGTVTITILCDTIPDKSDEHIPDDGILLEKIEVEIENGDTVYDVLSEVVAINKIHLETTGKGDSLYVEGIGNIYEFDFGDLSGWMYFVNGESPSVSCGEYVLSVGDEIAWIYTCELGEDIK